MEFYMEVYGTDFERDVYRELNSVSCVLSPTWR